MVIVSLASARRWHPIRTVLITMGIAVVLAPAAFAAWAGAAPFDALARTYPGPGVAVLTAATASLAKLAAAVTIGALVWHILAQPQSKGRPVAPEGPSLTILRVAAATWLFAAVPLAGLAALDSSGTSPAQLGEASTWVYLLSSAYAPGASVIHVLGAFAVFLVTQFTRRGEWFIAALWAGAWAVLAPVAVGQVLVGPNHDFASDLAYFQALAEAGGLGLILVTATNMALGQFPTPVLWRRLFYTVSALVALALVPEPLLAWFKLVGTPLTGTLTGLLLLVKWASGALIIAALLLGARLTRRGRATAVRLAAVTTAAAAGVLGWLAAAATMLREPPPQYFVPTSIAQVFMGYDVDAPVSWSVWFTDWRPNLFFLVLATGAIGGYLYGVRRLARRGDPWPPGRTIAWCLGWVIAVVITSSGFGKYSAPDFATHMIVHMTLNMLVPVFLVLGGAITLALRATTPARGGLAGVHTWITWMLNWRVLRWLYNPLFVFAFFIVSYYGLYLSAMFGKLMPFHWGHQLMNVHFLIVGVMFYSLVIGVDPTPRQLPHIGKLGYIVAAMPFHAFFGIVLMTSRHIIGEDFYRRLDMPWADLANSQYVGGGITWAGGELPLLVVVIALGIQWAKQDAREARRKDRHFDTGFDAEFDAYNAMLEKLAAREASTPVVASPRKESHD